MRARHMPEVEVILVEEHEPEGPFGAKGVGEIGLVPTAGADNSNAVIRYLNEAQDGFDEVGTGSSGLFVLVGPGLAETFEAVVNGEVVAGATAGSAAGAVFIMMMDI